MAFKLADRVFCTVDCTGLGPYVVVDSPQGYLGPLSDQVAVGDVIPYWVTDAADETATQWERSRGTVSVVNGEVTVSRTVVLSLRADGTLSGTPINWGPGAKYLCVEAGPADIVCVDPTTDRLVAGGVDVPSQRSVGEYVYTALISPAPPRCLPCNGSYVSIAQYPRLYAYLGTSMGPLGGGGTTFKLPDFRARSPVCVTAMCGDDSGRITVAVAGVDGLTAGVGFGTQMLQEHQHPPSPYRPQLSYLLAGLNSGGAHGLTDTGVTDPVAAVSVTVGSDGGAPVGNGYSGNYQPSLTVGVWIYYG